MTTPAENEFASVTLCDSKIVIFLFDLITEFHGNEFDSNIAIWGGLKNYAFQIGRPDLAQIVTQHEKNIKVFCESLTIKSVVPDQVIEISKPVSTESNSKDLRYSLYSMIVQDTLITDFSVYFSGEVNSPQNVSDIFNFDKKLLPDNLCPNLGQTILFFGQVKDNLASSSLQSQVANSLSESLTDGKLTSYRAKGILFDSPIFSYDTPILDPMQRCHTLIWVANKKSTIESEANKPYYHPLCRLLANRAKILYTARQTELSFNDAVKYLSSLEANFNALSHLPADGSERISFLENLLQEFPQISVRHIKEIRDLRIHKTTLTATLHNYQLEINRIAKIVEDTDDLCFLTAFKHEEAKPLEDQSTFYIQYLEPSTILYSQLIDTFRGILELESQHRQNRIEAREKERIKQNKNREKKFSKYIAFIGISIAVSTLSAQIMYESVREFVYPAEASKELVLGLGFIEILLHLLFGVLIAAPLTYLFTKISYRN